MKLKKRNILNRLTVENLKHISEMIEANNDLDISEFFKDDDSEGHRLAEFIRQRRGGLKAQNCLFMNYEPERLSLNVELEKIPSAQRELCSETNENTTDKESDKKQAEKLGIATGCCDGGDTRLPSEPISGRIQNPLKTATPGRNVSPITQNPRTTAFPIQPLTSVSPRRMSPRCSYICKSAGISPSDSLRRNSLRRRTLLQEFESTIGNANFLPPVSSTPQTHQGKPASLNCSESAQADNVENNSSAKSSAVKNSSCSTAKELKNYMGSKIDNKKCAYTVEIAPDESTTTCRSEVLSSKSQISPVKLVKNEANLSSRNQCRNVSETANPETIGFEESNTNEQRNTPIEFPTKEVEIPEIQDQPNTRTNSIIIQPVVELPLVIPIDQNFNRICGKENPNSNPIIVDKTKINGETLVSQPMQQSSETDGYQVAEDHLKLTDIFLTEDEDETLKTQSVENNSQAPLNLAVGGSNLRIKRFQKRREIKMDSSHQLCSTETEPPAQAYINRGTTKRICIPLNKAPGIPQNGENFSKELARMGNYKILDLRKRNSVGQALLISGRRSTRSQKEADKKKHQLDSQIEKEIIKRNLGEMAEKQNSINDVANMYGDRMFNEHLPVPDEFCDPLAQEDVRNNSREPLLTEERPPDSIPFKNTDIKRQSNKTKEKEIPGVFNPCLEVQYIEEKNYSTTVNAILKKRTSARRTRSTPYASSPAKSHPLSMSQQNFTIQKCQPTTTSEVEENFHNTNADVIDNCIAAPPPGFESDCGANTISNNQSTTISTLQTGGEISKITTNVTTNSSGNNEDLLFKVPDRPAPRKQARKQKVNPAKIDLQESATNSDSTDSIDCTLRRSKRGNVPLRNLAPSYQFLFEKSLNVRLEYYKKKLKEKQVGISKTNSENKRKTVESILSGKSKKIAKSTNKKALPTKKEDHFITCQHVEILNRKKGTKTEESKIILNTPPPVDHLNNVFDQLKNAGTPLNTAALKVKPFKIRVARLKSLSQPTDCSDSANSSFINKNSNCELISWLKNMTGVNYFETNNAEIFKEMRISAACNMSFTQLQGVEYALYDTDENACLGYLRFKPHQIKPKKRAKYYHLHFITLAGSFKITVNDKVSRIGVGDMVAVKKFVYYDIENISDDIGILMVIKK